MLLAPSPPGNVPDAALPPELAAVDPNPWLPGRFSPLADCVYNKVSKTKPKGTKPLNLPHDTSTDRSSVPQHNSQTPKRS